MSEDKNNKENIIQERLKFYSSKKGMIYIFTTPTLIWFVSIYITSLLMIIGLNISRVGFNLDGIFGGPNYYMRVFMFYGLNATATYESPWLSGIRAWIFAPFVTVFFGLALYSIKDGGFAYNSTERSDPLGSLFFAFFKEDVYGYEINIFGEKGNIFYIALVWIPIIVASLTTIMTKKRLKRDTSLPARFIISAFIAILIANEFARMTDPTLSYSFAGLLKSLFVTRDRNHFAVYSGEYPPTMIATYISLIQIYPMVVMGLFEAGESAYKSYIIKRQFMIDQKLDNEAIRNEMDIDSDLLPWEDDLKQRKQEAKEERS